MRAHEFIIEDTTEDNALAALPPTFVLPDVTSKGPYAQYRYGVALASARARANGDLPEKTNPEFEENMVIVARSKEEEETMRLAASQTGNSGSVQSSTESSEVADTYTVSPINQNSGKRNRTNRTD